MNENNFVKKNIAAIFTAACVILLAVSLIFIQKSHTLNLKLKKTQALAQQMQDMVSSLQEDKNKLTRENEKLNADTITYIGINTKLQSERDELEKTANELKKSIEIKEVDMQKTKDDLAKLEKRVGKGSAKESNKLAKERDALKKKMAEMEIAIKKERGTYHYNLGVAYAKSKLYDEAILEYNKALKWDPDNAEANYNIALLYKDVKDDQHEARRHFRQYVKLNPDASDKEEVEDLIHNLK